MNKVQQHTRIEINEPLLKALTPLNMDFKPKHFMLGDTYTRVLAITKYPARVNFGWLSDLCKIDGVSVRISVDPTDSGRLTSKIDNSIREYNIRLAGKITPSQEQRYKLQKADAEKMLVKISKEQESVSYITVLIQIYADSLDELDRVSSRVQSKLAEIKMYANSLVNEQEAGFLSIAPFGRVREYIKDIAARNIPVSTLGASIPFAASGVSDKDGFLLGKDSHNGIIQVNPWLRGGDRINGNWLISGNPGGGKSATAKHIMYNEWARGTRIIAIDPEGELKEMAKTLGLTVYDMGGSGMFNNPLQVNELPAGDEKEETRNFLNEMDAAKEITGTNNQISALSLHIKYLRTFFSLQMRQLDPIQTAYLEEALETVYKAHNIDYNTDPSKLSPKDYPILEELYYYISNEMMKQPGRNKEKMDMLHSQLRSAAIGADSHLWNGHTNIDMKSQFIVMETSKLIESDITVKRTQFFNLMTWAWQQVINKPQDENILIVADEAYLMVDSEVPETLINMRNMAKRIRKRNGGLMTIVQSINDFLAPSVRQYGQDLLDLPCFKLFLGADGVNLEQISTTFHLNDAERDLVGRRQRGHGLFLVGNERHHVNVMISNEELEIFGKGGGR